MISVAAILSLLLLACFAAITPVAAEETAQVTFGGSVEYLSPSQTGTVVVHVAGVDGRYNYNVSMEDNVGSVTPKSGTTDGENFTVKVTAPSTTGDITLIAVINGTANTTVPYVIHVIAPVQLTAMVKNIGNLTVTNIPVQFWVDDKLVNETTFTIPANATKTLYYNWTVGNLPDGQHTLRVTIDPGDENVKFLGGTKEFTTTFYSGESSWNLVNILLTVAVAILLLVLFFGYMNKGRKKRT
jgi:hypothetical protein